MAASGRRLGFLQNRLLSCLYESLGPKAQQRGLSSAGASSQIGAGPSTSICCTVVSVQSMRTSKGRIIESPSSGAAWVALDTRGKTCREFVRQVSTWHPSQAATKEGEIHEEAQEEHTKSEEAKVAEGKGKEEVDEKTRTLRAALAHVPKFGWTEAAIVAGARDVGLSPAIAGAYPRKEGALVEFFMDECTQALVEELESREEELRKLVLQDRIARIVWVRLEMQIPYLPKWAQALSVQANPVNLPTTLQQRALLIDEIWHSAGDRSTDMDWYAKRAMLAGVYSATELYMLTDTSPGFRDSRDFLERRITDALDCRKTVQEAGHLAQAVRAGLQNTLNSILKERRQAIFVLSPAHIVSMFKSHTCVQATVAQK